MIYDYEKQKNINKINKQKRKNRYKRLNNRRRFIENKTKKNFIKTVKTYLLIIIILILIYVFLGIQKEDNINIAPSYYASKITTDKNNENNLYVQSANEDDSIIIENENSEENYILGQYNNYDVIAKLNIPKLEYETNILANYSIEALDICPTKYIGPNPNTVGNFVILRT